MARENQLISEITQAERPKYEMTYSTHSDVIVDTIIEFLRQCFQNHPYYTYIPREDSFGPDFDNTKIVIVDRYTEDALFLPVITLSLDGIQTRWLQFSQSPYKTVLKYEMNSDGTIKRDEEGRPVPSHYEYTGAYEGSFSLTISAEDTISREELANTLHILFAESGRDTLYMRGIFVKDVSAGGQSEEQYRNDYIYQQSITVSFWSEWVRKIPVGPNLEKIGYDMGVIESEIPRNRPAVKYKTPEVFKLETQPYVEVDGESVAVDFMLSATETTPPIAFVYNSDWQVSDFWKIALEAQGFTWAEYQEEINKKNPLDVYLQESKKAVLQARFARSTIKTQGRRWVDGTYSYRDTIVYTDGRVELRNYKMERLIYNTNVSADDSVITFRQVDVPKSISTLVVRNFDVDLIQGQIYKQTNDGEVLLVSSGDTYLDGSNFDLMTPVDLLIILMFGKQDIQYPQGILIEKIDKVLEDLVTLGETTKLNKLLEIKNDFLNKVEKLLIRRPLEIVDEKNVSWRDNYEG